MPLAWSSALPRSSSFLRESIVVLQEIRDHGLTLADNYQTSVNPFPLMRLRIHSSCHMQCVSCARTDDQSAKANALMAGQTAGVISPHPMMLPTTRSETSPHQQDRARHSSHGHAAIGDTTKALLRASYPAIGQLGRTFPNRQHCDRSLKPSQPPQCPCSLSAPTPFPADNRHLARSRTSTPSSLFCVTANHGERGNRVCERS